MRNRSVVLLLSFAALVPIALSLHAKTSVRPAADGVPVTEAPIFAAPPAPQVAPRARATTPGTLAASLSDHPPPPDRTKPPTTGEWAAAENLRQRGRVVRIHAGGR